MDEQKGERRRGRIHYIDKKFQLWFIVKFCVITALGSLLTILLVHWLAQQSTTVAIANGRVAVHTTADYLLPLMTQTVLIQLAVVTLAASILLLLVSHKIAGPLYRFRQMLKELGEGNVATPMRLRKGDQLLNLADCYSKAVSQLNDRIKRLKKCVDQKDLEGCKKILEEFKTT